MALRIMLTIMLALWGHLVHSQAIIQLRVVDEHTEQPIEGVSVHIIGTNIGGVSGSDGLVKLTNPPLGNISIRLQLVGYEKATIQISWLATNPEEIILVSLHESHDEMGEVVVTSTRSSRTIADLPTRIEFIAGEELDEKANMKPGDIRVLLSESTGILVQTTSPTSANASIRIQGLDGRYTQLLKDGFPLYSGAASGLSLLQIPPLDLKQVEVLKGSASTLYGGGAIAGLVNLISKTPTEEGEISFLLNGTNAGGFDASGFYSKRNEKVGTTLFAAYNSHNPYDPAGIGLSAIPKFQRFTVNPKLFLYPTAQTEIELGLNMNYEDRLGGNMSLLRNESNTGNAIFEQNESGRVSSQFALNHHLASNKKLQIKNSINYFQRVLSTNNFMFHALQKSTFSEVNYQATTQKVDWVIGGNVWTEVFEEKESMLPRDYSMNTYGLFVQNTWNIKDSWTLESGLRGDHIQDYGLALLPRIALLWKGRTNFSSRFGGGMGYKAPTIFTEESERLQYQNILPISTETNVLEKSYGLNWDLNYKTAFFDEMLFLSINHLFFYTYLDKPLFLKYSNSVDLFQFTNITGFVDTKGIETNLKWIFKDFKWFMGYTYTHARIVDTGSVRENPLTPRHRVNSVLFYEVHDKVKIGWESYYFSTQQLSDGTVGQSYWIMGFMAEKIWDHFSLYINFENFLDARQTRFDSIFTGSINNPQFREIYAPLDGFVINGGIKIRL